MSETEEIARFARRAMLFNDLETRRRKQKSFWLFFSECCGRCGGSGFVENILTDVTAVQLQPGGDVAGPDILLERKGNKTPVWLLFSRREDLPVEKVAHCMGNGIDVFELDAGERQGECSVLRAHIATGNCRDRVRKRLAAIWRRLRESEIAQVGVREDFRSQARKEQEIEDFLASFDADMDALKTREVYCDRCGGDLAGLMEGSYGSVRMIVHRPEGQCGWSTLCDGCWMELMGGMTGNRLPELSEWSQMQGCPECEALEAEEMKDFFAAPERRALKMPESYGVRLVHEPEKRVQQYEVADRTVAKEDLLAVLMMLKWWIRWVDGQFPDYNMLRRLYPLLRELDEIAGAVLLPNNISDWDWKEGVGDSYVSQDETVGYDKQDRLISLKWFMREVPPFPLEIL